MTIFLPSLGSRTRIFLLTNTHTKPTTMTAVKLSLLSLKILEPSLCLRSRFSLENWWRFSGWQSCCTACENELHWPAKNFGRLVTKLSALPSHNLLKNSVMATRSLIFTSDKQLRGKEEFRTMNFIVALEVGTLKWKWRRCFYARLRVEIPNFDLT